jgi:hypothetical protein
MELELTPEQLPSIVEAVAGLLAEPARSPDPWWQAGVDEALET